jgi:hypothetical protein
VPNGNSMATVSYWFYSATASGVISTTYHHRSLAELCDAIVDRAGLRRLRVATRAEILARKVVRKQ